MKTKIIYLICLLICSLLVACSTTANLYPVEGPLSKRSPLPVIVAKADGIMGNTGNISLSMPDGEYCNGKWSSAAGVEVGVGTVNLFSQYGSIFGNATSIKNVPGVNRGEAILIGEKGTVMEVEFYTGSGTANGYGLAKDNKGNIYKLIF